MHPVTPRTLISILRKPHNIVARSLLFVVVSLLIARLFFASYLFLFFSSSSRSVICVVLGKSSQHRPGRDIPTPKESPPQLIFSERKEATTRHVPVAGIGSSTIHVWHSQQNKISPMRWVNQAQPFATTHVLPPQQRLPFRLNIELFAIP